jgi:hypothetical protein
MRYITTHAHAYRRMQTERKSECEVECEVDARWQRVELEQLPLEFRVVVRAGRDQTRGLRSQAR